MAKRISRTKTVVANTAQVISFPPSEHLVLRMFQGDDIDVSWMSSVDNANVLVKELHVFLDAFSARVARRGVANAILRFLRFVVQVRGLVGVTALVEYRKAIDSNSAQKLNSKYQLFNHARNYVRHLMAASVIPHYDLPPSFQHEAKVPKRTFVDFVRYQLDDLLTGRDDEVETAKQVYGLDDLGAKGFVFADSCMRAIHEFAVDRCKAVVDDWTKVDGLIAELHETDLSRFAAIGDFSALGNDRSIDLALKMLYAKFGRAIPPSESWPRGLVDYCKKRDWPATRLRGAFFPTVKSLDPFLALALANRTLMPNVDSVAFYAYTDCCAPAHDPGATSIHLGKKRGNPISGVLPNDNELVVALLALTRRVQLYIRSMSGGKALSDQESVPIFVHYSPAAGRTCNVRSLDTSSTSDMMRRFMRHAAENHPVLAPIVDKVTGENFRSTHIYLRKLAGESYGQIKLAAHHRHQSTTEAYGKSIETEAVLNRKHKAYQTYLVHNARDSSGKRTGSGYLCRSESDHENECIDFGGCHLCDAKRIVFGNPAITAEWLAWETLLLKDQTRLEMNNPERWRRVWAPKLVECQTFIAQSAPSIVQAARDIAKALTLPPID